jgi:hypothetical protein
VPLPVPLGAVLPEEPLFEEVVFPEEEDEVFVPPEVPPLPVEAVC